MSEHENDFREVVDEDTSGKDSEVVEVTGDTTVDPTVADPNKDQKDDYEDICYICRRPESVAGKMIHIPNNICICNDCMQKTFDSMGSFGFGGGDNANLNNIDFSRMIRNIGTPVHVKRYFLWCSIGTIFFDTSNNVLNRSFLVEFSQIFLASNYPNIVRPFCVLQKYPIMSTKPKTIKF